MCGLSKEFITDRLILRSISSDDREFIFSEFSDTTVTRYLFGGEPLTDISGADRVIESFVHPDKKGQYRWIIIRKSDKKKMGTCGFHCWNPYESIIELGYDMQKEFWGNGYMQEAVPTIINFIIKEMNVKTLHAHVYYENQKSALLVKKLGFVYKGKVFNYPFRNKDYLHQIYELDCEVLRCE